MGRVARGASLWASVWLVLGCSDPAFFCQDSGQCDGGQCEINGYCSFPDPSCGSGRRFGDHAPGPISGECVSEDEGTGGASTGGALTAGPDPDTGVADSSTGAVADGHETGTGGPVMDSGTTSSEPVDASSTGIGGSEDSGTTGGDGGGPPVPADLFDDFDRPDALEIGGGWLEKRATSWRLLDGQVRFESDALNYEDNIVYRPFAEAVRDVEVGIQFEVTATDADNHPQVHVRIQPEDIEIADSVTGYILYVDHLTLRITRQLEGAFASNPQAPLPSELGPGQPYRLSLRVTGEDPVELEGRLFVWDNDEWMLFGEILYTDDSEERISSPGSIGWSGSDAAQITNIVYDNFTRLDL